jgi:hypothetical protein
MRICALKVICEWTESYWESPYWLSHAAAAAGSSLLHIPTAFRKASAFIGSFWIT